MICDLSSFLSTLNCSQSDASAQKSFFTLPLSSKEIIFTYWAEPSKVSESSIFSNSTANFLNDISKKDFFSVPYPQSLILRSRAIEHLQNDYDLKIKEGRELVAFPFLVCLSQMDLFNILKKEQSAWAGFIAMEVRPPLELPGGADNIDEKAVVTKVTFSDFKLNALTERFEIAYLSLNLGDASHANCLIIDNLRKTILHYEPSTWNLPRVHATLLDNFKRSLPSYVYRCIIGGQQNNLKDFGYCCRLVSGAFAYFYTSLNKRENVSAENLLEWIDSLSPESRQNLYLNFAGHYLVPYSLL